MNFGEKYNRQSYLDFFQNQFLTDNFTIEDEELKPEFKPTYVKNVTLIGRDNSLKVNVFEI